MSVRTELMRFMVLALMLAPSWAPPPKEGSFCWALPQPTGEVVLVCWFCARLFAFLRVGGFERTACEETVFREDCYGVDEEDGDWYCC